MSLAATNLKSPTRVGKMEVVNPHRQAGATLAELLYVLPLFFIMLFGIFEMSYVYRTKSTLNAATFEAARAGAVGNANKAEMKSALASGMLAQFMRADRSGSRVVKAYAEALAFQAKLSVSGKIFGHDSVEIVSPNRSVFKAFSVDVPILENNKRVRLVKAIPNDNLMYRPIGTKRVKVNGNNLDINIQDANLLKITSMWCHPLKVPGLRELVDRLVLSVFLSSSSQQKVCNAFGKTPGFEGVYVAITSQAIVRMQSPIYIDDLK